MIESEDLLNQVEDIFFELVLENLSEEKFNRLQAHPQALFLEIHEDFSGNWEELLYEAVESDEFLELGVYLEVNEQRERLALFLMSLDIENNKECHIQW